MQFRIPIVGVEDETSKADSSNVMFLDVANNDMFRFLFMIPSLHSNSLESYLI
jgi:hypothetical protein